MQSEHFGVITEEMMSEMRKNYDAAKAILEAGYSEEQHITQIDTHL